VKMNFIAFLILTNVVSFFLILFVLHNV